MIETVTYRCLRCDNCGTTYDIGECDDDLLLYFAEREGWKLGLKDYCPECAKRKKSNNEKKSF